MDVKPWEPVFGGYCEKGQWRILANNPLKSFYGFYPHFQTPVYLTLMNGQRVVVRPLSSARKAARVFQRRVTRAVEANR